VLVVYSPVALFAAVVFAALFARTRLWWLPSSVVIAAGVAFVGLARGQQVSETFFAVEAVGHVLLWAIGIGMIVLGAVVLAMTYVLRSEHQREQLRRRAAETAIPAARVVR
jgi:drug/metabolite transporter (DMT)-like permease